MEYYWLCDCYVVSFLPDFERTTIDRYKSIYEYCFHRFSSSFRLFFSSAFLETYSAPYAARIRVTIHIYFAKNILNSIYKI